MDKIRIGIVGSGGMARRRAEIFDNLEEFELVAVAARNPETGPALAEKHGVDLLTDWQALMDRQDVDAVVTCTNNDSHGPIAAAALDAGKHVLSEYPVVRSLEDASRLESLIRSSRHVLRLTHRESISAGHRALKTKAGAMGNLLVALFARLTPGRGARPEVLFNLPVTGPPALFFVYHVYALVDLFGPAAWVESGAEYVGLSPEGRYDAFVNTLTVGFEMGGLGQWTWSGGVEIAEAEEFQRIVLSGGTLIRDSGNWNVSARSGMEPLPRAEGGEISLEAQFYKDVTEGATTWREDAQTAVNAARIGLAAEISAKEGRRIRMAELT